jgi:hypothetical protein
MAPNAAPQLLPEAGARDERTLAAVSCRRLLDNGCFGPHPTSALMLSELRRCGQALRNSTVPLAVTNDRSVRSASASRASNWPSSSLTCVIRNHLLISVWIQDRRVEKRAVPLWEVTTADAIPAVVNSAESSRGSPEGEG